MKAPAEWVAARVAAQPYWFQKINLGNGIVTPGWSDPEQEKLPFFGLPDDMSGMRVLDIGCSEGFFSFEAERRGATSVVALDAYPGSIERFIICRDALGSRAQIDTRSVYELDPKTIGTFDLVMFFGVLYHLRHPLLALDRIRTICAGDLLFQTAGRGETGIAELTFLKDGIQSGPQKRDRDPTVFFLPTPSCVADLLTNAGFVDVAVTSEKAGIVARGTVHKKRPGVAPDETLTPWS